MTKTGKLYGDSLYELAVETDAQKAGFSSEMLEELMCVRQLFSENPEYMRLLAEPSISRKERLGMLDQAFSDRIQEYLLNFLKILCEGELLSEFGGCCEEYKKRYQEDHNISEAYVTSAAELDEAQKKALKTRLEEISGRTIILITKTDASLIGGMKVVIDGKQLDGSIRSRLERLHKQILQ